jgi:hypothetical protein
MKRQITLFCLFYLFGNTISFGQANIYSKEGRPILNRFQLIGNCLRSLRKDRYDKTAVSICECQTNAIDRKFTNRQYKNHTKNGIVDMNELLKEDSIIDKQVKECFTSSGQTTLIQAQGFQSEFITSCIKAIQNNTEKTLDIQRVTKFCSCQLELVKSKKITDSEMETLSNPNSLLFYEMIYKCGDPFQKNDDLQRNWTKESEDDIKGPAADTLKVLNLNGMTYIKVKVGSLTQLWLFDTGALDLLINTETEQMLRNENIINQSNYLGTGEYEMANGMIDTCRKYKIDNVQIGKFILSNIIVAVTDKGKRIIIGRALLNKFRNWALDNQENNLILSK